MRPSEELIIHYVEALRIFCEGLMYRHDMFGGP